MTFWKTALVVVVALVVLGIVSGVIQYFSTSRKNRLPTCPRYRRQFISGRELYEHFTQNHGAKA